MPKRIILTGGGTAGSVTSLIAVADNIKKRDRTVEFLFVGSANGPERVLAETAGINFEAIPAGKLRRYWSWHNFSDLNNLWHGFLAARRVIRRWRPQTVVSSGSYVSVPVVWAGRLAGCKTLVHQQDVRPGLANRLMVPAATVITVTFSKSLQDFPRPKVVLTGNPVRPSVLNGSADRAREIFNLDQSSPVLLVAGGGTGSNFLNQITAVAIYKLIKRCQIIHLTGAERKFVQLSDPRYHRFDFLVAEMSHALAVATIVVSRAGLGMITELSALAKPTIFVPMPLTHQEENAEFIAERQAGLVVAQSDLTPEKLINMVNQLLDHPDQRESLARNIHELYQPAALDRLTDIILNLS